MPVGLVVALGGRARRGTPATSARRGPNTRSSSARRCGFWTWCDQVAQVGLHVARPARGGPSSRSSRSYSSASAGAQRAHRELRRRSAGATRSGRRRARARRPRTTAAARHVLADQRDDGARAVAERQPQVLAVAVRAQLALAHEQHLLDVLAVGELANEHGARTLEPGGGRLRGNIHACDHRAHHRRHRRPRRVRRRGVPGRRLARRRARRCRGRPRAAARAAEHRRGRPHRSRRRRARRPPRGGRRGRAAAGARQPRRRLRGRPAGGRHAARRLRGACSRSTCARPTSSPRPRCRGWSRPAAARSSASSSHAALQPLAGGAGYAASKAAVIAFARVGRQEHAATACAATSIVADDDRHAGQPRGDARTSSSTSSCRRSGSPSVIRVPVQRRVGAR